MNRERTTDGPKFGVVLAAAGRGRRFRGRKQFIRLCGRPLLHYSLDVFTSVRGVCSVVVVAPEDDIDSTRQIVEDWRAERPDERRGSRCPEIRIVGGGARRQDSVQNGLEALAPEAEWVLVHDVARPLVQRGDVESVMDEARAHGAAVVGHPVIDSVKRARDGWVDKGLEREQIWQVQTPQAGRTAALKSAYAKLDPDTEMSDEVALLESVEVRIRLVKGARENIKLTHPGDEELAAFHLERRTRGMFRTGLGFDLHRLVEGRPLWLGGVEIPAEQGALAHSDGDVLLHALTDALLGAIGAGDIGEHFPDTDPRWKDKPSSIFLERAARLVDEKGYALRNLDATIFLEVMKLSPYKQAIVAKLRELLNTAWDLPPDAVNVKAKTLEGCDAVGRKEAIAAQVVVLLEARRE